MWDYCLENIFFLKCVDICLNFWNRLTLVWSLQYCEHDSQHVKQLSDDQNYVSFTCVMSIWCRFITCSIYVICFEISLLDLSCSFTLKKSGHWTMTWSTDGLLSFPLHFMVIDALACLFNMDISMCYSTPATWHLDISPNFNWMISFISDHAFHILLFHYTT